jgi:5-methylcytosine-specific restriction endonuclease McrA
MAMQNLRKEKQREIRLGYRTRQLELTADYYRRKREAGIPTDAPVTLAGQDRALWKRIAEMASPERAERHCRAIVFKMFAGLPRQAMIQVRADREAIKARHRAYRARLRAKAIHIMGGKCQRCGFDDHRALQFDHVQALRRGSSGVGRRGHSGVAVYRQVIRGRTDGIQLLCANCHVIKTLVEDGADGLSHINIRPRAPAFALPSSGPSAGHTGGLVALGMDGGQGAPDL